MIIKWVNVVIGMMVSKCDIGDNVPAWMMICEDDILNFT